MVEFMPMLTGTMYAFKAYQDLVAPDIDYDILNIQAEAKELRAEYIKNQVEEEANMIRQEFNEAIGAAQHAAARRGVKVGEGNVAQNIEKSSKAMGEDVQTMRENAEFKAQQLGAQASRLRKGAVAARDISAFEKIANVTTGAVKAYEAFESAFGAQSGEAKASKEMEGFTMDPTKKKKKKKRTAGIITDFSAQSGGIYRPIGLSGGIA